MTQTYQYLKDLYEADKSEFRKFVESVGLTETISILAFATFDNGWPLGMLKEFHPKLASALKSWTAGGYEEIRSAQQAGEIKTGTPAFDLEASFDCLPLWNQPATHASKDSAWLTQLSVGSTLELQSFMGCCAAEHSFAYVSDARATLFFTELKTARLVGALSTENMEREVLLPRGAKFAITCVDQVSKVIRLVQESAT